MIGVAAAFYLITVLFPETFLTFIVYEAIAMLFAFAGYLYLAMKNRLAGAWWMVAGILVTIVAAAIQAAGKNGVVIFWGLDHKGGVAHQQHVGSVLYDPHHAAGGDGFGIVQRQQVEGAQASITSCCSSFGCLVLSN